MGDLEKITISPKKIGRDIKNYVNKKGYVIADICSCLSQIDGMSKDYARQFFYNLRNEPQYFKFTKYRKKDIDIYVKRLSELLYIIGIDEDNEIIRNLKELDPKFPFPPNNLDESKYQRKNLIRKIYKRKVMKNIESKIDSLSIDQLMEFDEFMSRYSTEIK